MKSWLISTGGEGVWRYKGSIEENGTYSASDMRLFMKESGFLVIEVALVW